MSKKRLCFSKTGMGRFISHLDLMRAFARAVLRAELPVRYTQGFNPHQIMSFALPLPVGVTSETEFVDIDFEDGISDSELCERLSANLPPDIRILRAAEPQHKSGEIVAARYEIALFPAERAQTEAFFARAKQFFAQKEVIVLRKTKKKGEAPVNLMEFLRETELRQDTEALRLTVTADAGGERNLKPALLTDALEAYLAPLCAERVQIHRTKLFVQGESGLADFC